MRLPSRSLLDDSEPFRWRTLLPAATVLLGSMTTLWPMIASVPVLPPFGLLMLLAWRLPRPELFPIWAAAPLGLFDDLVSGQPLGSAMLLWMLGFLLIDILDQRPLARDYWLDWLIAAACIALALLGGRFIATRIDAHVDTALLLQSGASIMLFPLISRFCAWLDRSSDRA